jgi:DNA-binding XRE family transcriptional regulator
MRDVRRSHIKGRRQALPVVLEDALDREYRPRRRHPHLHGGTLTAARKEQTRKGASIASQIGASRNAVGTWESGGVVPNARSFVAWADALGFDVTLVRREAQ